MADIARIKRNVGRMVEQEAPESDIDEYIRGEGVTLDQVRGFKGGRTRSPEVMRDVELGERVGGNGFGLQMADTLSFGAFNPVSAALSAAGSTAVKAATGRPVDFSGDYTHQRDVLDERLARSRDKTGLGGTVGEIALSLPFAGYRAAGTAAEIAAPAVADVARSGVQRWLTDPAKAGALYGGIYGFNSARGGVEEHASNTAGHAAMGAAFGPAFNAAIHGAVNTPNALNALSRYATGRGPANIAANQGRLDQFANANVRPFGPEVGGTFSGMMGRNLAGSLAGGQLRSGAQGTIDDITRNAQNALARHTNGMPVNDLGAGIQDDLSRVLTQDSIPRNALAQRSLDDLAELTGPMTDRGFRAPPPQVEPILPRPVSPVPPRSVDPNAVQFETVQPTPVRPRDVKIEKYPDYNEIQIDPSLDANFAMARQAVQQNTASLNSLKAEREQYRNAKSFAGDEKQLQDIDSRIFDLENRILPANKSILKDVTTLATSQRDAAWREAVRETNRKTHAEHRVRVQKETEAAQLEAATRTEQNRLEAIRRAEMTEAERASAETTRMRAEAIRDAEAATERARVAARAEYEAQPATNEFVPGRTRESYPTEFAAAYEQAARISPQYRANPMGGPTSSGRALKTETKAIVEELADEGHRRLHIRGKDAYDEKGQISPQFEAYLKQRLGNEIGMRLAELSRLAPGHAGTTPRALKELRTEIRKAAEAAERPPYPEQARTAEAAWLRRLQGALGEDMAEFSKKHSAPAPSFQTETLAGETTGMGAKIGDLPKSDLAMYLDPRNLERLTGTRVPNDHRGTLPATRQIVANYNAKNVAIRRNDTGEMDEATRVPFQRNPEVGLRPVQVWADGAKVHYGAPITSRARSPGEVANDVMRAIDTAHARHMEEIRAPLARIFGDRVQPIEAMDRIVAAANQGNLEVLRPFMRVMTEKANPTRAAASVITHATQGAQTLDDFIRGYQSIPRDSRDVLFSTPQARELRMNLERLAGLAERMRPYERAITRNAERGVRISHLPLGAGLVYAFWPTLMAYGGAAAMAKFMASPRYVRWLTEAMQMKSGEAITKHINKLSFAAADDNEEAQKINKAARRAMSAALSGVAPSAKAAAPGSEAEPASAEASQDSMTDAIAKAAAARGVVAGQAKPQDVIDAAWESSPTDAMAEAIEFVAKQYGLKTPWDR